MTQYTLYGGELSLYTGKARAYLRYKNLDWCEKLATRDVYKSIILPQIGAPIVPVLETSDGHYIQDTTDIIDFLEARHPQCSVYPDGAVQKLVALLLECYGDDWLVIPAMHYRWSVLDQQSDFIFSEFGRMSAPEASYEEQIEVGRKTSSPFRGSIVPLGVTQDTIPGIETAYATLLEQLNTHFAQYDYLLGSRPSIGDFGLIGPLYAHLARDPIPKAIMQETAPAVYQWVQRMNDPVPLSGEFLADDAVPDTLLGILETLCADFLPDVLDVIAHNKKWMVEHPGENIPRALGMHSFHTGGVSGERFVNTYSQWMYQRPWRHYQSLESDGRQRADKLLLKVGGLEALQTPIEKQVKRKRGQLELVEAT
jgi:glutathione S-transferase